MKKYQSVEKIKVVSDSENEKISAVVNSFDKTSATQLTDEERQFLDSSDSL